MNKSKVYLWFDDFNRANKADITTESSYGDVGDAKILKRIVDHQDICTIEGCENKFRLGDGLKDDCRGHRNGLYKTVSSGRERLHHEERQEN